MKSELFPNLLYNKNLPRVFDYNSQSKYSTDRGLISEMKFLIKSLENGWEVSKPIHHSYAYDFVIKRLGIWETVQVKTACRETERKHFAIKLKLKRTGKSHSKVSYKDGDFDLLGVVYKNDIWLIPWNIISKVKCSFGIYQSKFEQFKL